jgi:hypothetical protein
MAVPLPELDKAHVLSVLSLLQSFGYYHSDARERQATLEFHDMLAPVMPLYKP